MPVIRFPGSFILPSLFPLVNLLRSIDRSLTDSSINLTDIKYCQFGTEIQSLGIVCKNLDLVFTQSQRDWHQKITHQHIDNINTATFKALSQVTGDFLRTLRDCERLLSDNTKFKRTKAGFVDNVVWHAWTEREIRNLTERVHFHQTKIDFIAKPLQMQLLFSIQRDVKDIKKGMAEMKTTLVHDLTRTSISDSSTSREEVLTVPPALALRFKEALSVEKPETFLVQDDLPLEEGFRALIFHYFNSKSICNPRLGQKPSVPDESQYLNLIKSVWILEKLKESAHFRLAGQDSLWAECIRELEGEIRDQLNRFQRGDLSAPSSEVLSQLPKHCFNIWVTEGASPHTAALTENQTIEEKILELKLPSSSRTHQTILTIFRKSQFAFRLVSTTTDDQNKDFYKEESVEVNMNHTRLIPTFAATIDSCKAMNNVLLCADYSQPKAYDLQDSTDVAQFQRALTAFRVDHDMSDIKWCIEYQRIGKHGMSGMARLQLWHLKPFPNILPQSESLPTGSEGSSISTSEHSPMRNANLRRFWTSGTSQSSGSPIRSPVMGSCGDGVVVLGPEPPILIIFTQYKNKYSFLHLQCMPRKAVLLRHVHPLLINFLVEEYIYLEKQSCVECVNRHRECSRILIKSSRRLSLKKLCAEQESDQGLNSWDLACFRHPGHPRFEKLETLNRIKYLSLHFADQKSQCSIAQFHSASLMLIND